VNSAAAALDLDAYLARVRYSGGLEPTLETLSALHLAHAVSIPFENLDVILGLPIALDLDSLQAKLVAGRRGGYCFEQNTLFGAVLRQMGFQVRPLAARVRFGAGDATRPRSHMLLQVDLDDDAWLADVGFGSPALLQPVRMTPPTPSHQFGCSYRVSRDGEFWVLQLLEGAEWVDLYAFTLEPQFPIDFEVANYYISTHPRSLFVQSLFVQLRTTEVRCLLRDRELTLWRGGEASKRKIESDEALLAALSAHFGLQFPAGTCFLERI
jgi:N-hydroxyarylamine O-acetyltransferase